jgi:hypothetical protein
MGIHQEGLVAAEHKRMEVMGKGYLEGNYWGGQGPVWAVAPSKNNNNLKRQKYVKFNYNHNENKSGFLEDGN